MLFVSFSGLRPRGQTKEWVIITENLFFFVFLLFIRLLSVVFIFKKGISFSVFSSFFLLLSLVPLAVLSFRWLLVMAGGALNCFTKCGPNTLAMQQHSPKWCWSGALHSRGIYVLPLNNICVISKRLCAGRSPFYRVTALPGLVRFGYSEFIWEIFWNKNRFLFEWITVCIINYLDVIF